MHVSKQYPHVKRWFIFVIGGSLTTGFTYLIYLILNLFLNYQWSFLIGYVLGVLLAYWFNTVMVFKSTLHWRGLITYPIVYITQYLLSALALGFCIEKLHVSENYAPLLVSVCMFPLTYIMNKLVIAWSNDWRNKK